MTAKGKKVSAHVMWLTLTVQREDTRTKAEKLVPVTYPVMECQRFIAGPESGVLDDPRDQGERE
jgi:hypothetical protein